jgi:mxaA protein
VAAREGLEEMRPDARPPPLSTTAVRVRLTVYAAGLAAIALYFVYSYLGLPFLARSRGPFARALRAVNAAARKQDERQSRQAALKALHRAFDETARGTVFGEHLDRFFAEHARYVPLRPEVERFFAASKGEFFGAESDSVSLTWLAGLCRDLRDRERGVA